MNANSERREASHGLGWKFWFGLVAVTLLCALGFMLALILFGAAWYEWGFVGAAILLIGVATGAKYLQDRRTRRQWS
jgi:Kef-type K+ transport system membrane component KefB